MIAQRVHSPRTSRKRTWKHFDFWVRFQFGKVTRGDLVGDFEREGRQSMEVAFSIGNTRISVTIKSVVVAGWTGRNREAVRHHIDELAALGIAPPSQVPLYYRVSNALLTQSETIEVLGDGTSGEIEPLLIQVGGRLYFGLASDHTDRDLERHSVAASKQACAKPVATPLWDFEEIKDHLEMLDRGERPRSSLSGRNSSRNSPTDGTLRWGRYGGRDGDVVRHIGGHWRRAPSQEIPDGGV